MDENGIVTEDKIQDGKYSTHRPSKTYRACVVGVFTHAPNMVLACERQDYPGQWQLPQGGVEQGETTTEAVVREMREELGTDAFSVITESLVVITYDFPATVSSPVSKKFRGQSQTWFHLQFKAGAEPNIADSDGEFVSWQWLPPAVLLHKVVIWKKDAYRKGFTALGFEV